MDFICPMCGSQLSSTANVAQCDANAHAGSPVVMMPQGMFSLALKPFAR